MLRPYNEEEEDISGANSSRKYVALVQTAPQRLKPN
jgi:hypothetical protein